jgi:ATP-dependent Clp protease ATP-binding subunit ClpC
MRSRQEASTNQRPYTTRAQKALAFANGAAADLGDAFIGTEHLLLGLLEEKMGPAAQMLDHLGVTDVRVREFLLRMRSGRLSEMG